MTRNAEIIREIVDRNCVDFQTGKEGYLFIGKEDIDARYFTMRCMMMIDNLISTYRDFIQEGIRINKKHAEKIKFPQKLNHTLCELKKAKLKDKVDALLRYNGFYACASSVPAYLPFFNNTDLQMFPPSEVVELYFQRIHDDEDEEEVLNLKEAAGVFQQILPFSTTCEAKMRRIGQAFEKMLQDSRSHIFFGTCSCPRACGIKIDIRNNALMQINRDSIEDLLKLKMSARSSDYEYVHELSQEVMNLPKRNSLVFHVTILGENAFIGYCMDPDSTKYHRFTCTE